MFESIFFAQYWKKKMFLEFDRQKRYIEWTEHKFLFWSVSLISKSQFQLYESLRKLGLENWKNYINYDLEFKLLQKVCFSLSTKCLYLPSGLHTSSQHFLVPLWVPLFSGYSWLFSKGIFFSPRIHLFWVFTVSNAPNNFSYDLCIFLNW